MTDPDNFLSRWSRRKLGADADNSRAEKSGAQADDRAAPPGGQTEQAAPKEDAGRPPAFDVASLPPLESIGAGTDISAFMQTGVPTALRHAALRRAWTADPSIKDYVGLNENFWDAAGPGGIIPGFGELDPGIDVKRMVSEMFGETTPDQPESEKRDSVAASARSDENLEMSDDTSKPVGATPQQTALQQNENGATQKKASRDAQEAQETQEPQEPQEPQETKEAPEAEGTPEPMQKMTRRHGGAMPE
jgi:hypothetical protein